MTKLNIKIEYRVVGWVESLEQQTKKNINIYIDLLFFLIAFSFNPNLYYIFLFY